MEAHITIEEYYDKSYCNIQKEEIWICTVQNKLILKILNMSDDTNWA